MILCSYANGCVQMSNGEMRSSKITLEFFQDLVAVTLLWWLIRV